MLKLVLSRYKFVWKKKKMICALSDSIKSEPKIPLHFRTPGLRKSETCNPAANSTLDLESPTLRPRYTIYYFPRSERGKNFFSTLAWKRNFFCVEKLIENRTFRAYGGPLPTTFPPATAGGKVLSLVLDDDWIYPMSYSLIMRKKVLFLHFLKKSTICNKGAIEGSNFPP